MTLRLAGTHDGDFAKGLLFHLSLSAKSHMTELCRMAKPAICADVLKEP